MKTKTCYICCEGTEGVGKTTQASLLAQYLRERGYSVLETKEPGTPLSPLTMQLRNIMLDKQYENEITPIARELISQAIRSIHLERIIVPAFKSYDFIVQDRGILSGLAYGAACGHSKTWLKELAQHITVHNMNLLNFYNLYDCVIYLKGDVAHGLQRAQTAKQEFKAGDAMEAKGVTFLKNVADIFDNEAPKFRCVTIDITGKDIQAVFNEIVRVLNL